MSSRGWITVIVILAILIGALAWLDYTTPPGGSHALQATTTAATPGQAASPSAAPDTKAVVTKPTASSTVASTFDISGTAPNSWYFEATFPIQVRDADDDLIGSSQGRAQSDWTVEGPVAFTSTMTVDASYHGPATLILLKDNPSGNPENSDELTVPITIK